MIDIAIIGAGSIGSALTRHILDKLKESVAKVRVFDIDPSKSRALAEKYDEVIACSTLQEASLSAQLLIETASKEAVGEVMRLALKEQKDLMVLSVGGLLGNEELIDSMEKKQLRLILPSGAIAGIDALKAARIAGIEEIEITTRKGIASVKGAPYLEKNKIDLEAAKSEQVIFSGTAGEAIKAFPKNINVSVLLSIAGVGADKTKVRIIVSPAFKTNTHQVRIKSVAGEITAITKNRPSPDNPKTSFLAALSAMAAVEGYLSFRRIGT